MNDNNIRVNNWNTVSSAGAYCYANRMPEISLFIWILIWPLFANTLASTIAYQNVLRMAITLLWEPDRYPLYNALLLSIAGAIRTPKT